MEQQQKQQQQQKMIFIGVLHKFQIKKKTFKIRLKLKIVMVKFVKKTTTNKNSIQTKKKFTYCDLNEISLRFISTKLYATLLKQRYQSFQTINFWSFVKAR